MVRKPANNFNLRIFSRNGVDKGFTGDFLHMNVFNSFATMNVHDIQKICQKYAGVTEDIKWQDHLCFNVGGKMFLITAPDAVPVTASLKVSVHDFDDLVEREGFMPAPYLARYKWIYMDDITRLSLKEWENYIDTAYHLVASKLPRNVKQKIGL